jgi:ankyrin repeat protein
MTPLHVAARAQATAVASLLLQAGADGGRIDGYGRAALHYAAQTADWALFSVLHARPECLVLSTDMDGAACSSLLLLPTC